MHPAIRALGKVLRLVGISSPEDAAAKPGGEKNGPPSWRRPAGMQPAARESKMPEGPVGGGSDQAGSDRAGSDQA
jgi:hypothetical protein